MGGMISKVYRVEITILREGGSWKTRKPRSYWGGGSTCEGLFSVGHEKRGSCARKEGVKEAPEWDPKARPGGEKEVTKRSGLRRVERVQSEN